MRWDKIANVVFWIRFSRYFLIICAFGVVIFIGQSILNRSVKDGPDLVKAEDPIECVENCEGLVHLDQFENIAGGPSQGNGGPVQGPVQGPTPTPSPAPPVDTPTPTPVVPPSTPQPSPPSVSPPIIPPTPTPHIPPVVAPPIETPTPSPPTLIPPQLPPPPVVAAPPPAISTPTPVPTEPPFVPMIRTCPVNNSCCAPGLISCTSEGLDVKGECPEPFKWCYSGVCIHRDFNPATNTCVAAPATPVPTSAPPVITPTPIVVPTPTPQIIPPAPGVPTTVTTQVPVSVSNVASATSTSTSSSTSSATGGVGGGANVTVSQTAPQGAPAALPQVVQPAPGQKVPVAQAKELPRTGLPLAAWAAASLLPLGFKLRQFTTNIRSHDDKPLFISQKREFDKKGDK